MPIGPSKYDDLCTAVREKVNAEGAVIIVIRGSRGSGFACQVTLPTMEVLPDLLETIARDMRADFEKAKAKG